MVDFTLLESKFKVGLQEQENAIYSICASDLVHRENMDQLLETYAPLIKADDLSAAATYFCSAFSTAAVALQFAVTTWNKGLDFSLSNYAADLSGK